MSVVSKNLYELLGNDPELDPNRAPEPPTKVVDKPAQRAGKRNGTTEAPVKDTTKPAAAGRGGREFTGSEQAARDKNAGSSNNRAKPTDDGLRRDRQPRDAEGANRGRGGRGGRGAGYRGNRGDRHDRSGVAAPGAQDKQAAHGWGGETGPAEYADEKAGLADARAEESKEGVVAADTTPVDAEGAAAEAAEEDNTKSYEQYLAEQLEKKAALGGATLAPRKANEGSSKKFPEGKAFSRDEEDFVAAAASKDKARRERKTKDVVDIDLSWKEEQQAEQRSTRGGARGGRGRGGPRGGNRGGPRGGDRPERSERSERPERAERTERAPRAPRGGAGAGSSPNVTSAQDFPSLS